VLVHAAFVGDLPGITARLPYLRDLGVDAVWLSPFYVSPQADAGYDMADYRDVDPLLGAMADADALLATAYGPGMKVIVDLVPNHSSDEHPWFHAALAAGPGIRERERYVFRDGEGPHGDVPANNWQCVFGGAGLDPGHLRRQPPGKPRWPVVPPPVRSQAA
jgi:alpha-glucosidase